MSQNGESSNRTNLGQAARALVVANAQAVLSTLRTEDGYPYASAVDYLALGNGDIVLLLSRLAEHRKYLSHDPRASVLIAPALNSSDMLAKSRLTLIARAVEVSDRNEFRDAYLARHPQARDYIDFSDFSFYRLSVEKARYISGFGRMGWLSADEYRAAHPD